MKSTGPYLKRRQAYEGSVHDILQFLNNTVLENLPPDYDYWKNSICGHSLTMIPDGTEVLFEPRLFSWDMSFSVNSLLIKLGLNTSCRTVGDFLNGTMGIFPIPAVLRYGKEHQEEIAAWHKAGRPTTCLSYKEIREVMYGQISREHDGGAA
jgi:hypothetical protein